MFTSVWNNVRLVRTVRSQQLEMIRKFLTPYTCVHSGHKDTSDDQEKVDSIIFGHDDVF